VTSSTNANTNVTTWLAPEQIFTNGQLVQAPLLRVVDGYIKDITSAKSVAPTEPVQPLAGIVSPGFFDIQVNGGGNVLFNTTPNLSGVNTIAAAHRAFGTTRCLPTVITDTIEVIEAACASIISSAGRNGIVGIHIEGPHISPARAGTHKPEFIRPLSGDTISCLRQLRDQSIPTLITLAPEAVSTGQIAQLVEMGVVVSLGHSDTNAATANKALLEGATLFTHLYNAMSPMQSREPGMVGAAINSEAYCSIICDGIHVVPEMIKLAINARPLPNRMIIVSDAMATVGGRASFELYGETISLQNGMLVNANGSLAGAHTTMADSIRYLTQSLGMPIETCLNMAITNPANLMGVCELFHLENQHIDECVLISDSN